MYLISALLAFAQILPVDGNMVFGDGTSVRPGDVSGSTPHCPDSIFTGTAAVAIPHDHPNITFEGAFFITHGDSATRLDRWTEEVIRHPDSGLSPASRPFARTQSGVQIRFVTESPCVKVRFTEREGAAKTGLKAMKSPPSSLLDKESAPDMHKGAGFRIRVDGKTVAYADTTVFTFSTRGGIATTGIGESGQTGPESAKPEPERVGSNENGSVVPRMVEIALPSMHGVDFSGLKLQKGSDLHKGVQKSAPNIPNEPSRDAPQESAPNVIKEPTLNAPAVPVRRPVYVAIGNSITHGTGHQPASYDTWPFRLAEAMDWELVNLAVAGAHIGPAVADLLYGQRVDVITILKGFNDWMFGERSLLDTVARFEQLLRDIRLHQPEAQIFVITPLHTNRGSPAGAATFGLSDLRNSIATVVREHVEAGDRRIHLLGGCRLSDDTMLMDGIHLSAEGAERFAAQAEKEIRARKKSIRKRADEP